MAWATKTLKTLVTAGIAGVTFGTTAGCAYTLQNSKNPALLREGVHKVYIAPLQNNSYKPGVENLVYNELVKSLVAHRRVMVVHRQEDADAILSGSVSEASYGVTAGTSSDSIFPTNRETIEVTVATEYQATLSCSFALERIAKAEVAARALWSSGFSRAKKFPGNNQKGEFGTTSPLINESEFDRALKEVAEGMMGDVHESMLAMF